MTTELVHRPARTVRPHPPAEPLAVAAPPTLPDAKAGGAPVQVLFPIVGALSSMTMMITLRRSPILVGVGVVILIVAALGGLLMVFSQRGNATRTRRLHRERYLDHLEELRDDLAAQQRSARIAATAANPDPATLLDIADRPERRWERRRTDPDFLRLRVGIGDTPWRAITVPDESNPVQPSDPYMLTEAETLAREYATIAAMPMTVDLDRVGHVAVVGPRRQTMTVVRALAAQAIALHAPDDLAVGVSCPADRSDDWAWAPWTPHLTAEDQRDGPVGELRTATDLTSLARLLHHDLTTRVTLAAEAKRGLSQIDPALLSQRLLIFSDSPEPVADSLPLPDATVTPADVGVTVVHLLTDRLAEPSDVAVRITVDDSGAVTVDDLRDPLAPRSVQGRVDAAPSGLLEGLARRLSPFRLARSSLAEQAQLGTVDVATLLGVHVAALDVETLWQPRTSRDFLRVPIGVDDSGHPVLLDLKESAQLGMGPHGLCVGATGSGKSELLRSLVGTLALTHPPEDLAFVLVDYKGGAAFAPLAPLPHVTGLITNLADDASLIERAYASLTGEVDRRQRQLAAAGDLSDIGQYAAERAKPGSELPPMPHLLVVIDEFGELLTAREDFIDLFLRIGRIGRSIGVHLLLASQRIEAGKLRGLETYLSYRLGLRTFSEAESSIVLETPDAYHLPPLPGFGWLKVDTSVYTRFRAAYASGPARADGVVVPDADDHPTVPVPMRLPFYPGVLAANGVDTTDALDVDLPSRAVERTLLDVLVHRIEAVGRMNVPAIWLPPLPDRASLDILAGRAPVADGRRGLRMLSRLPVLQVPVGLVDDPRHQRQETWSLDLTTSGGHVVVIGAPQSGKSTLIRTIALSLALTHTPEQVAIYGLDLAGGALAALRGFPHVAGVAVGTDAERVRRTVDELGTVLDRRERVFAERSVDSLPQFRARHAAGEIPELRSADVVVLIDGFGALRNDFEQFEDAVTRLMQRGPNYGIHVVGTVSRWNDIKMALQPAFGTRIELHLNDPADSVIARRLAATIRADQPGRALLVSPEAPTGGAMVPSAATGLFAQTALPRVDAHDDAHDLGTAIEAVARQSAAAWPGDPVPAVKVLPPRVAPADLPDAVDEPDAIPIALSERTLEPVLLDLLGRDQHLLVLGDTGSGKTAVLRAIARGLAERRTDTELVIAVIDSRTALTDVVPEDLLGGYAHTADRAEALTTSIAKELATRVVDVSDLSVAGTRYTGPQIVVLIDDYDLITAGGRQPLEPLMSHLPGARDVGLHIVLTRPVAGASRGLWDPAVSVLRDTGGVGLILDGDRSEGVLLPGVHAAHQPPGRGLWVRRGRAPELVQIVDTDTDTEPGAS